ncbi:MAG: nucleoside hydrolase [Candidatus Freyarchaeum deiterrae]
MKRIIIDTDVGLDVDDAYAISLAAKSPELTVEGITTVYGDTLLRARIALKLLKLAGRSDIPVIVGEGEPITENKQSRMLGFEGEGILKPKDKELQIPSINAVDFITSKALTSKKDLTIVTIGALTNIALALKKQPDIKRGIKELVIMGGIIYPPEINGEKIPYDSEYNFNCDPEAAKIVFECEIPKTLVPMDITMKPDNYLTEIELTKLQEANTPLTATLLEMTKIWLEYRKESASTIGISPEIVKPWMHDPLAVTVALKKEIFKTENYNLRMDILEGKARIIPDAEVAEMKVCTNADFNQFKKLLIERLTKK